MIKTSLVNRIEKMFLEENVTMKKLYKVTNTNTEEQLSNVLFDFINVKLDNCHDCESVLYLADVFNYIPTISLGDRDRFPKRKVQKLYEKIDRLLELDCQKIGYFSKYPWQLTKIRKELENREESVLYRKKPNDKVLLEKMTKENEKFRLVTIIIDKIRNLKYLENTFKQMPSIVNSKNNDGQSLYFRYAKKYIEAIENPEKKKDINYLNVVLLLIKQQSSFKLEHAEEKMILNKVKEQLRKINKENGYAKTKKNLLENLYKMTLQTEERNYDIHRIAKKYNINMGFKDDIINEINYCRIPRANRNNRFLVKDYTITIDCAETIEIDDALSIRKLKNGNYLLGLHIANVLGYLDYNTKVVNNAISRASTIYLPKQLNHNYSKVIPIFPLQFSGDIASLLEKRYRLTNSYFVEFDSDANVVNFTARKMAIKSNNKCSYDYANQVLRNGSSNERLQNTLFLLNELTCKMEGKFLKISDKEKNLTSSEKIVEYSTKLVNSLIADYFYKKKYPFLYRVHGLDEQDLTNVRKEMEEFNNFFGDACINNLNSKFEQISSTRYDTEGIHEELGAHYCHATSPLRRGADIIVEHCLDVCYFNKPTDKQLYRLEEDIEKKKNILNYNNGLIDNFLKELSILEGDQKKYKKVKK